MHADIAVPRIMTSHSDTSRIVTAPIDRWRIVAPLDRWRARR
jgi:hypothetical protein